MVNRKARDLVAQAIRQLHAGQMTWDAFDALQKAGHVAEGDRGLGEVYWHAWVAYDPEYPANRPSKRRDISRLVLFLQSDLEYQWRHREMMELVIGCLDTLTLQLFSKRLHRRLCAHYERQGDTAIWPFLDRQEYEDCLRNPKLLKNELKQRPECAQ